MGGLGHLPMRLVGTRSCSPRHEYDPFHQRLSSSAGDCCRAYADVVLDGPAIGPTSGYAKDLFERINRLWSAIWTRAQ